METDLESSSESVIQMIFKGRDDLLIYADSSFLIPVVFAFVYLEINEMY